MTFGCDYESCEERRPYKESEYHNHRANLNEAIKMLNNNRFTTKIDAEVEGCYGCWYGHNCRPTAFTMQRFAKIMSSIPYRIVLVQGTSFKLIKTDTNLYIT